MITPEGIISYPAIFEAKENQSGVMKYSCSVLFDKSDKKGIKLLEDAVAKAVAKGVSTCWNGKTPRFRYEPLRDGDAELAEGIKTDPIYKGKVFLNCSSNDAPGVVDSSAQPLMDKNMLYAGCIVRLDVNPFPYIHSGNSGIGWGLNHVMFVREGDRLDGRVAAEDAFAKFATDTDSELM